MEDFKIWVYLAFAAIYLISRAMKKKEPEKKPRSPLQSAEDESPRRKAPASFEELLREFTEEHERQEATEQEREELVREPVSTPSKQVQEEIRLEGEKRHFADDESRAIYERSIQEAEGADISYERDEHFKMKRWEREEEENTIASELKNMLRSPSDAKKAVVLSEILNRRY